MSPPAAVWQQFSMESYKLYINGRISETVQDIKILSVQTLHTIVTISTGGAEFRRIQCHVMVDIKSKHKVK